MRLAWLFTLCTVLVVSLTACTMGVTPQSGGGSPSADWGADLFTDDSTAALVAAIPERTVAALPASRLAEGLIPPTNKWFSGLVFGDESMPVFPLPLSFQLTETGFAFGLPTVTSAPNVIMGGFRADVGIDVGADNQLVTAFDTASVTIVQRAGDSTIGSTVIAQGSPFVSFTAAIDVTVSLNGQFAAPAEAGKTADSVVTRVVDGVTYGLVTAGKVAKDGTTLQLSSGQSATWFPLATGGTLADFVAAAGHPLTGTSLDYGVTTDRSTTTIGYHTANDAPTLIAAMPHQYADLTQPGSCDAGTYPSVNGTLKVCAGRALGWSVPTVAAVGSLPISALDDAAKNTLADQVSADVAATAAFPADTYFGGKALYRAANLYSIATQVGADAAAATIKQRVVDALDQWMQPDGCAERAANCFVYDSAAKGIVGLVPSFGSDVFNDHHFHYGYFFNAAAVLAADDPALADAWAPVLNLLAADLATSGQSTLFPERRVFDAYAGHSWASGTSPFGDGNNQESSSEAVSAWNGLALWAQDSGQQALQTEAEWMLSAEAASARAYWTDFDRTDPVYSGFGHSVTSLVWGGKRDFATWFSAEQSAMLGILVLPMSPVSDYLGADPDRVAVNVAEAAPNGFDVMFGDYLLMYSALAGPEAAASALDAAQSLPAARIDDGDSRSYLLAWLLTHQGS